MKRIFTLFITALICSSTFAQINKGSSLLGGSVSFYSDTKKFQDTGSTANYNLSVTPAFGKAINTNSIVGISLLFNYGSQQTRYSPKLVSRGYGIEVFARKYKNLSKAFYLFAEGNLSTIFSHGNYSTVNTYYDDNYKSKSVSAGANLIPGVAYTLTKRMQLEATLQNLLYVAYTHTKDELKTNSNINNKENVFVIGSNLNPVELYGLGLGVRFLLSK